MSEKQASINGASGEELRHQMEDYPAPFVTEDLQPIHLGKWPAYTHPRLPGKIIRFFENSNLTNPGGKELVGLDAQMSFLSRRKNEFTTLEKYGIHVVEFDYFVAGFAEGRYKKSPGIWGSCDFVTGENPLHITDFDEKTVTENQPPRRKRTGYGESAWANARA